MIARISALFYKCCYYMGIIALFFRINRGKVVILAYHGITKRFPPGPGQNHIDCFKKQIIFLKKQCRFISLSKYLELQKKEEKRRSHYPTVIITFDDGQENVWRNAFHFLVEQGIPATLFLSTDFIGTGRVCPYDLLVYTLIKADIELLSIDYKGYEFRLPISSYVEKRFAIGVLANYLKTLLVVEQKEFLEVLWQTLPRPKNNKEAMDFLDRRYMNWNQVREMMKHGFRAGSHTCGHYILSLYDPETVEREICHSKEAIEREVNQSCSFFCYPNGQKQDYNSSVIEQLKRVGYTCAVTTISGLNGTDGTRYELKRLGLQDSEDKYTWLAKICGIHSIMEPFWNFLAKCGIRIRGSLLRLWLGVSYRFYVLSGFIAVRDLQVPIAQNTLPDGFTVRVIEPKDEFLDSIFSGKKLMDLHGRLSRGAVGFVVETSGRLAYHAWVATQDEWESTIGINIPVNQSEAYLFDCYTCPEYRRLGLHTYITCMALRWAKRQGKKKMKVVVHDSNIISRHVFAKVGFESFEKAYLIRLFGIPFRFCMKTQKPLRPTAKQFGKLSNGLKKE